MSVREYIGARYLPLFPDDPQWSIANAYEPLTVVQNLGSSYISRQYVPAGIQLSNTDYWVLWADFNSQIEQYRAEVQTFDGRITANANDIDSLESIIPSSDFTSSSTVKDAIDSALADIAEVEDLAKSKGYVIDSAQILSTVDISEHACVYVNGYFAAGDGGSGMWIPSTKSVNGIDVIATATGAAEYSPGPQVNAAAVGVINGAANIDARISKAFDIAAAQNLVVVFPCPFEYASTIHVTAPAIFCKRIQYNGSGYGLSYEAGSMNSLIFQVLASTNGGGLIMEQTGSDTIMHANIIFDRIYAGPGIGMYLHSTTHGIMECTFAGNLVNSRNHALSVVCEDGYNETNAPFFGQNVFSVERFTSLNQYAVNMEVGNTWSTITGVVFHATSFEGSANGIRFSTGTGERAQLKGVHINNLRTFEQLSGYTINLAGGNIWACSVNCDTPITVDKINVNANALTNNTSIPFVISGGIMSPTQYIFADKMEIRDAGKITYSAYQKFNLHTNATEWRFGSDTYHYRIIDEIYADTANNTKVYADWLSPYGINSIRVNQNKGNNSTAQVYDADGDLIFDGPNMTDTGRTAYLITVTIGAAGTLDGNKKVVTISKFNGQIRTIF